MPVIVATGVFEALLVDVGVGVAVRVPVFVVLGDGAADELAVGADDGVSAGVVDGVGVALGVLAARTASSKWPMESSTDSSVSVND